MKNPRETIHPTTQAQLQRKSLATVFWFICGDTRHATGGTRM